jgi:hypothetical protein
MICLFKHYIPHAVLLLGRLDLGLPVLAGEAAWQWRAHQIGVDLGDFGGRGVALLGTALGEKLASSFATVAYIAMGDDSRMVAEAIHFLDLVILLQTLWVILWPEVAR